MYMGDDIPDIEIMQRVGLAVAPRDAAIDVLEIAQYILPYDGGMGCGREIIEQVYAHKINGCAIKSIWLVIFITQKYVRQSKQV